MNFNLEDGISKIIGSMISENGGRIMRCLDWSNEAFGNEYDEDIDFDDEDLEELEDFEEDEDFLDEDEEEF